MIRLLHASAHSKGYLVVVWLPVQDQASQNSSIGEGGAMSPHPYWRFYWQY